MFKLHQYTKFILGALAVILLAWVMWQVRQIGIYFGISVVLALMGRPLMDLYSKIRLGKFHLPEWLKALMVLITFIGIMVVFVRIFIPILSSQIQIIASLDVEQLLMAFEKPISQLENWARSMHIKGVDQDSIRQEIAKRIDVQLLGDFLSQMVSSVGSLIAGVFSVLFITFFLLKDWGIVNRIVETVSPDKYIKSVKKILGETKNLLSRYFLGIALQVTIIATIVSVGLKIVGIPNALLIGVITGIINIIPYLGPIIGGLIGITLGILSNIHLDIQTELAPMVFKVLSVFAVAQLTDNLVLQPVIFSKSVRAHPLEIFFVILIAGTLMGIGGMILAVPFYTFMRIVAKEFFQGYKIVQGLTKDL